MMGLARQWASRHLSAPRSLASATALILSTGVLVGLIAISQTALAATPVDPRADSPSAPDNSTEQRVNESARLLTGELATTLGSRLKSVMSTSGPVAAVGVCHVEAPVITADVADSTNVTVGRTALKVRNSANSPDAWEREQLEHFQQQILAGEAPDEMSVVERIESTDGRAEWRYMSPIMTGPVCLACHGDSLAPDVAAAIAERYPEDQATGFSVGELRGAFTVRFTDEP